MSNWKARFFTIWTGQAFSLLGSSLVDFALIWWLTETTGSERILAFSSLLTLLPRMILCPFAGSVIDRLNRKTAMILADGAIALVAAIFGELVPIRLWYLITGILHVGLFLFWMGSRELKRAEEKPSEAA